MHHCRLFIVGTRRHNPAGLTKPTPAGKETDAMKKIYDTLDVIEGRTRPEDLEDYYDELYKLDHQAEIQAAIRDWKKLHQDEDLEEKEE